MLALRYNLFTLPMCSKGFFVLGPFVFFPLLGIANKVYQYCFSKALNATNQNIVTRMLFWNGHETAIDLCHNMELCSVSAIVSTQFT
jgi:hypothetical protein